MARALTTLLERPELPLPAGDILAGIAPALMVGTPTAHPADVVEVFLRRDGIVSRVVRAIREPGFRGDPTQWFRALLPPLQTGAREDYRVEWTRAGRRVAMLPADGSWLSLLGVDGTTAPAGAPAARTHPASATGQPRFGYDLEFFAALTVNLRPEVIGATPDGYRANFFITDGCVVGPRIEAEVLPDGGDWMHIRPDGVGMANIRITLAHSRRRAHPRPGQRRLRPRAGRLREGRQGRLHRVATAARHRPLVHGRLEVAVAQSLPRPRHRARVARNAAGAGATSTFPRVGDRIGRG